MSTEPLPWRDEFLPEHFRRIDGLLRRHRPLWREQAFQQPRLQWEQRYPELAARLRNMELARAEQLAEDDAALAHYLSPFIGDASAIFDACRLPRLSAHALPKLTEGYAVPGRKWQQINAFAACVSESDAPLLEWCSGKAYLSHLLARAQQRSVAALEWDRELVAAGNLLAQREQLPVRLHCVDVLSPDAADFIAPSGEVVALHACGQLHVRMLQACARRQPAAITLAPCCYHLGSDTPYKPLSQTVAASDLELAIADLHTAVRDSVTSPQRVQRQRKMLQAWRLGFDLWQREARARDDYLSTPSLPLSMLKEGFVAFCSHLAAVKGIALPTDASGDHYERMGWQRLREVAGLDLARILFRRPLELWLLLDRALFMREQGYAVELGTFCERRLTPRNVALRAQRL